MSISYQIVFTADILHDYYKDKLCPDFEIFPSHDTSTRLRAQGMLWRFTGNRLTVAIRTDDDGKPYSPLSVSTKLKFYLKLNNPYFDNFTNLTYQPSTAQRYYFSNINQTQIGSTLHLNSKIPSYNNTTNYPVGSFASNPSDEIFEAIRNSENGDAHGLTEQAYWLNREEVQYVNSNDLVEITPHLDGDVVYSDIFGIMEFYNHLNASDAFALFDAQGKPKGTAFTLRFANRSVIWKYLARTNDITAVEDIAASSPLIFTAQPDNQFISTRPIPLTENPITTLLLKSTALGDISPLANPGNIRMGTIVKDGNTYLCSELYLNY